MADYGLTTANKKFGSGSFFSPYGSTTAKSLAIEPTSGNFSIAAGQDFIISVWVNYDDPLTTSTLSDKRYNPVVQYGFGATNGAQFWGLGWESRQLNPNISTQTPSAYFQFNTKLGVNPPISNRIQTSFTGSNQSTLGPVGWSNWLIQRSSGVITFTFTNGNGVANVTTVTNNQEIAPFTDSRFNTLYVGATNPVSGTSGAYIDELFFARGVSTVQNRNSVTGAIRDGLLTSTAFLYQFDGNYYDDESGTKDFAAALTSTIATAAELTYVPGTKQFAAALTSGFTTTASGAGPVAAQAALTVTTTVTTNTAVTKLAGSQLTTTSTATVVALKLKLAQANLTAFNSQVTAVTETRKTSRPYTLYMISGSAGNTQVPADAGDISTTRFKYGTGSLTVPGFVPGIGGSYAIVNPGSTTSNFAIGANTDFYISFWTLTTTTIASPGVGVYLPIFQVAGLQLGYFSNGIDPFFRSVRGDFTPMISTANIPANTWHQWEAFRTGDTFVFRFNGSVVGNRTYSGATASNTSQNSEIDIGAFGTARIFNFDEVFVAIGANSVQTTRPSGEIGDGSLATTQVLYHFNGDAVDDITGTQTAQAALASTSTVSVTASEIARGTANLTSSSAVTAAAIRVRPAGSALVVTASITSTVGVIKESSAAIVTTTAVTADAIRLRAASSTQNTNSTAEINAVKTAQAQANITAATSTITVTARRLAATASMFADSQLTAQAEVVRTAATNITCAVQVTATASKTARAAITLAVTSSLAVQAITVKQAQVSLTTTSQQTAQADRFARVSAAVTATATLVARPVQEVKSTMAFQANLTVATQVLRGTARANLSTRVMWSYIYDKTLPFNQAQDLWIVPADTRLYVVPASSANWIIEADQRTYIIEPDLREYKITPAATEFTIEG